jgi:alkaline phosphatase D
LGVSGGDYGRRMDRRTFLSMGVMGAASLALGAGVLSGEKAQAAFPSYPFKLGVASGDPLPDGVVLWTRLAPYPLRGGGMPQSDVAVRYEVSEDAGFRRIVRTGTVIATPGLAHSVHVEVSDLQPARYYWYRFKAGSEISAVGRTKTAPAFGAAVSQMNFAFASCQNWEAGFYSAYRAMAAENLDLVVHLGDYPYEGAGTTTGVRSHKGGDPITLADYRNRHAQYKTDPNLRAAHAAHPWMVTWDDHEVDNNYAGLVAADGMSRTEFTRRRAAAYRAYYEHLPLRHSSLPSGASGRIYRRLTYGNLVRISALDPRQYRTDQPCGDGLKARCADALSSNATLTGPTQEGWLLDGLGSSPARWNVIAQQVVMAQYDHRSGSGGLFNMDAWDGYVAARNRVLGYLLNRRPSNPIVITGDVHSSWVADLKADFRNGASRTVGTEFVGTSITSRLPASAVQTIKVARAENPHVKYFDGRPRGYVRCNINADRWRSDLRLVGSTGNPQSAVGTLASFVVQNGRPGRCARSPGQGPGRAGKC